MDVNPLGFGGSEVDSAVLSCSTFIGLSLPSHPSSVHASPSPPHPPPHALLHIVTLPIG